MPVPLSPLSKAFPGGCAFVDGAYVPLSKAKISLFDWGFTRSDATYDVASVWRGAFFRLDAHIERFFASLATLRLSIAHDRAELREVLHGCVRASGLQEAYVSMICTRGVPPQGSRDLRLAQNSFYAYAVPYVWIASPQKQLQGLDLHISGRVRIAPESVDPTVKNFHWLDLVQSVFDAYDHGRDSSCVVDAAGHICEGPGFNVFMVKDGVVRTTDRGVLQGISRRTAIELCQRMGLPMKIAPLPADEFRGADEVFLTSTAGGILPVAKIDGKPLPQFPGPVTSRLSDLYWAIHEEALYRDPVESDPAPSSKRCT